MSPIMNSLLSGGELGLVFAVAVWIVGFTVVPDIRGNPGLFDAGFGAGLLRAVLRTGLGITSLVVAVVGLTLTWGIEPSWYRFLGFMGIYSAGTVLYFFVRYRVMRRRSS